MDDDSGAGEQSRRAARRRRLLDEVFGEVLPGTTRDEREPGRAHTLPDDWYRENRPPHHDR